ncbi:hypothetical protein CS022_13015 [Veronia nyctiphanis]|uniref:Uncharacterized protein n=1 Tax=Veronia nyctiphanis TaxID=1278244 RepID=A0A4Q0YUR5_9GAMM|nr:hypothetical protein CS022_13015 [Veronia nyctiphanis]
MFVNIFNYGRLGRGSSDSATATGGTGSVSIRKNDLPVIVNNYSESGQDFWLSEDSTWQSATQINWLTDYLFPP